MSGHSKWATIKRQKGKADAARGKLFNRLIREISIAARQGGGDPEGNPRLRSAIATARGNNMPNKNIDNAIAKGTGQIAGVTYEEAMLEGYGPGGVAVLVELTTDNRNRTVAEVRHVFTKAGGNLGAGNSVAWMFASKGIIRVPKENADEESLMEIALEAGADDMVLDGDTFEISTEPPAFESVREALEKAGVKPESAELTKIPENTVKVEGETAARVLKMLEMLDELDDTQRVYSNFEMSDADMQAYGNG
ncbi:MAG: YebC/PmpR family DNA-binding transcriptional regulator [Chitinivibrionales bacterium]|nr:YebC/PmpR family DNA-binding transcriptional regulator [Chitinivibrionales bacterium]MBD3395235.1 YebC/PmpR family DNA-binding transcriptional regulator [Chitinivibrionales bacterium]